MGKPGAGISLLFSKAGLMLPSDGRIAINNTYAFTSYALQRDLGFNPSIFAAETNYYKVDINRLNEA